MEKLLDKIINIVNDDNSSLISDQKIKSNLANPLKDKFLNNLDDMDESIGNFNIKIFGIGGAGCNVIKHMKITKNWPDNVKIYAMNTDVSSLKKLTNLSNLYLLGKKMLRGAGSGGDPFTGKISVDEDREAIKEVLKGTDILFLIAGLGKGTGSGATPEIAKIAKKMGILTVSIVNLPSITAEGSYVYQNALSNLEILKKEVSSLTVISNDLIIKNNNPDISFIKAFEKANQQVTSIITEVVDIINNSTEMNIDFADVKNFFNTNSIFNANTFELDGEYTIDSLKSKIKACIESSYADIELENAQKIIVNLKINELTPTSIISDIRGIFKSISNNNDLSVISGVDYTNLKKIRISFLISVKEINDGVEENEVNLNSQIIDSTITDQSNKTKQIIDSHLEFEQESIEQYKTENVQKNFIKKEKFNFENELSKTEKFYEKSQKYQLDSNECVNLINKAMTNVLKTNTIINLKQEDKKRN